MMMLALRIRKAEVAVKDGRLDEAYKQAVREDVRDHRKGQRLINQLTKAFQERARKHLKSGNATAAMSDVDRASRLGGNQPDIVSLRDQAKQELDAMSNQRRERRQKLNAVRNLIAAGKYTMGAKVGEELQGRANGKLPKFFGNNEPDNTLYGIMQDAEFQREQIEEILSRGRDSLKAAQWDRALDALDEAKKRQPNHAGVATFTDELTQSLQEQIRKSIVGGRLDQASHLLRRTLPYSSSFDVRELARVVERCRSVAESLQSTRVESSSESLKALQAIVPDAKWLNVAIKETETISRSLESIRTGPLGSFQMDNTQIPLGDSTVVRGNSNLENVNVQPAPSFDGGDIPDSFLLHLDEAGSFLVVRRRAVTIGKKSRSSNVDVALQSMMGMPSLTIERTDDDYFLMSDQPVGVNGKAVTSTLLNNGAQIRVGRRGLLEFTTPNAASTSAAIELKGIRMASGSVRKIILMDDDLIIGPQSSSHIRSSSLERSMVLHWRDGQLRIRPMMRATEADSRDIVLNRPHDVQGLSLVVTEVS